LRWEPLRGCFRRVRARAIISETRQEAASLSRGLQNGAVRVDGMSPEKQDELLEAARLGDREAIATLLSAWEPIIRARFRAMFQAHGPAFFDSSDFFATMLRRVDERAVAEALGGTSDELGRQIHAILLSALREYAEAATEEQDALRLVSHEPSGVERTEPDGAGTPSLARLMDGLDVTDRVIVALRLRGVRHHAIGAALGLRTATVRTRWMRLLKGLRAAML
jgi:DNA-directed RNA polymerase specialized sigma24 family protein